MCVPLDTPSPPRQKFEFTAVGHLLLLYKYKSNTTYTNVKTVKSVAIAVSTRRMMPNTIPLLLNANGSERTPPPVQGGNGVSMRCNISVSCDCDLWVLPSINSRGE